MLKNLTKVAIVKLSALGDIIHCMVALQFIKKYYPNLIIDWFVQSSFSELLKYNPHIRNIYKIDLKSIKKNKKAIFNEIKLIRGYSKNQYDFIIDAQGLIKSAIVSRLIGKNVVGFSKTSIREKFASNFYQQKIEIPYEENVIHRNIEVLCKPFLVQVKKEDLLNKKPFLFFKDEFKQIDKYLSNNKKNILLVIGASLSNKIYCKEKFVTISHKLDENYLIIWGNDIEKNMAKYIEKRSSNSTVLPKLDLNSLKALVSKVDLVIGGDTGPTHMAWALNIPSITLFGNTLGCRNTYETNINKIIQSNAIVNPLKLDKKDFSIKDIDENCIVDVARKILYEKKD